jgi:hypothetical protein
LLDREVGLEIKAEKDVAGLCIVDARLVQAKLTQAQKPSEEDRCQLVPSARMQGANRMNFEPIELARMNFRQDGPHDPLDARP